jgi:hypothetical protein
MGRMMQASGKPSVWLVLMSLGALGCGSTSGPVLERIEPIKPPAFTYRVDVFLVTSTEACAIGRTCTSADTSNCFWVDSASGRTYFEPASVEFVPPDDPRLGAAARSACFELDLDQSGQDTATRSFGDLRTNVYQLSGGAIDLALRLHPVAPAPGVFKLFEGGTGIFLQPSSLEPLGLPLMSPDSDFAFAVTGETNAATGALPRINPCAGTNWQTQGGLGGTQYTWLSASCLTLAELRWHFLYQSYFALRDVVGFEDLYAGAYPSCGQGAADTKSWFPRPSDCAADPDAPSCGQVNCDEAAFAAHVLTVHWPNDLVGNHCRNGRTDYDETAPDTGGVCDELGR